MTQESIVDTNATETASPAPASNSNASAPTDVVAPAPRKRGRPRKNPQPEAQAAPAVATTVTPVEAPPSLVVSAKTPVGIPGEIPGGIQPKPSLESSPDKTTGRGSKSKSKTGDKSNNKSKGNSGSGQGSSQGSNQGSSQPGVSNGNAGGSSYSGKGKNNYQNNGYQSNGRRPRRSFNNAREQIVPQTNREDLEGLKVGELREKAAELELDITLIKKKDELIEAVHEAMVKAEGFVSCKGILDLLPEGYGFLRTFGYLPGEHDVYVGMSMVRRNALRKGDLVTGQVRPARDNEKYAALHRIDTVNEQSLEDSRNRRRFAELTPVYPDERLLMEHGTNTITARTIDLVAPIGKGQRGLIVSPPKAGKTTILKDIAAAISANNPDVHLMCLLVDERPEEVTDMERSIKGEVVSSTFDMPSENHIAVAELVVERAKRLVEIGKDVVILLDSITRLARAYNLAQPASGRILSGGVDSTALYPPKRFLGAARNIEDGGSLTILASALIETGSKMDEVIFEEFKGTGNMELRLDRDLADRRIFPAIDPVASGTRKEDLLLDAQEAPLIWAVRRILANMNNTERSMEMLIKSLKQTQTNAEFLMRTAKKAQQKSTMEIAEL